MFDPSAALRQGMIGLSKNTKVRDVVEKAPVSKDVVKRFVAGTGTADAVSAVRELDGHGKLATLDFLGEDTSTRLRRSTPATPTSTCWPTSPTPASPTVDASR